MNSELHRGWHHLQLSMELLGRNMFLFWLNVPISRRQCKEAPRTLVLARFQLVKLAICKASVLHRKGTKP